MKIEYNGFSGIAALIIKRNFEKGKSPGRKPWNERVGVLSQLCREQKNTGNRRERRRQAKLFIKNPLGLGHV